MKLIDVPIDEACKIKWDAGQKVYGTKFVGHPLEQCDEEFLDAENYFNVADEWGYDMEDIPQLARELQLRIRRIYAAGPSRPRKSEQ